MPGDQSDRFTSAEKNSRVVFTGALNSSRGMGRLEDAENMEPNRLIKTDNNQINHYKSFNSLD